jgi:hypothetical protein
VELAFERDDRIAYAPTATRRRFARPGMRYVLRFGTGLLATASGATEVNDALIAGADEPFGRSPRRIYIPLLHK